MYNIELNFPLCLVFDEITEFDIRNTWSIEELKRLVFINIYTNWRQNQQIEKPEIEADKILAKNKSSTRPLHDSEPLIKQRKKQLYFKGGKTRRVPLERQFDKKQKT